MKRPNITPGKWKKRTSNGKIIVCREDFQAVGIPLDVCRVWQSSFTEANARAIASVPKLLAALESALSRIEAANDHQRAAGRLEYGTHDIVEALTQAGYTFP